MMQDHAEMIALWIAEEVRKKYRAGQLEHGGDVTRKEVSGHALEELIDMIVYFSVMSQQKRMVIHLLTIATGCAASERVKYIKKALNILEKGNSDGEREEEKDEVKTAVTFDERWSYSINKQLALEVLDG